MTVLHGDFQPIRLLSDDFVVFPKVFQHNFAMFYRLYISIFQSVFNEAHLPGVANGASKQGTQKSSTLYKCGELRV